MKRSPARLGSLLVLALAIAGCGDDEAAPSSSAATTSTSTTSAVAPTTETVAPTSSATTSPSELIDVKVYLMRAERLVIAHRQVQAPAVLRGALTALLEGPTAEERAAGIITNIPTGTTLLDVALADGTATVDLSGEFESGGGSLSMFSRITEVVFTATQFPNVERVVFWMDGAPVEMLGGEGIILEEPQSRMDWSRDFTGGVLIDTPRPGDTVRSPFIVTGEGDVYEGEFPIEVWANGQLVDQLTGVRAGAWGTWAPFSVTITLDLPPGPIELVAYDEGGCGDSPECPPIVKTVVPLTLVS